MLYPLLWQFKFKKGIVWLNSQTKKGPIKKFWQPFLGAYTSFYYCQLEVKLEGIVIVLYAIDRQVIVIY